MRGLQFTSINHAIKYYSPAISAMMCQPLCVRVCAFANLAQKKEAYTWTSVAWITCLLLRSVALVHFTLHWMHAASRSHSAVHCRCICVATPLLQHWRDKSLNL